MVVARTINKPATRSGETLRPHVRKDGTVVYVPTEVSVSYAGKTPR